MEERREEEGREALAYESRPDHSYLFMSVLSVLSLSLLSLYKPQIEARWGSAHACRSTLGSALIHVPYLEER